MNRAELQEWLLARLREVMPMGIATEVEFHDDAAVPVGTVRVTVIHGTESEPTRVIVKPDREAQRRAVMLAEMGRGLPKEKR